MFSAATSSVQTFRIGKSITNGEGELGATGEKLNTLRSGCKSIVHIIIVFITIIIVVTLGFRNRLPYLLAAPRLGKLRPEGVSLFLQLTREALQALRLRRLQGQPGLHHLKKTNTLATFLAE